MLKRRLRKRKRRPTPGLRRWRSKPRKRWPKPKKRPRSFKNRPRRKLRKHRETSKGLRKKEIARS